MTQEIKLDYNTFFMDGSFIPFMRSGAIEFSAEHLRPGSRANIFFDTTAVNLFCQRANKIYVNSKKAIRITPNTAGSITTSQYVFQGSSLNSATFYGTVESYYSANTTVLIKSMSGNFDESSTLYVTTDGSVISATGEIIDFTNHGTADLFAKGEEIYCQNTGAYMTVVGSSGENILYVNQNYITINVSAYAGGSLQAGVYRPGDIIYQKSGANPEKHWEHAGGILMYGTVMRYNSTANALTLKINSGGNLGKLTVNSSAANTDSIITLRRDWSLQRLKADSIIPNDLSTGNVLVSVKNTSNTLVVSSYNHYSSLTANTQSTVSAIKLNSSNIANAAGNNLYITDGTCVGQTKPIVSVSGLTATVSPSFPSIPDQTSKYSIGEHVVDENGGIAGIFHVPEYTIFSFLSGQRVLRIVDSDSLDGNNTMGGTGPFVSGGGNNTNVSPVPDSDPDDPVLPGDPTSTGLTQGPSTRIPLADGLSQTFFVPNANTSKTNYGIFVSSVDLFFKTKPSTANASLQLPVTVRIAKVSNGYPTKNYIASCLVKAKDIKVSNAPSTSNTSTVTKFRFPDPVFLSPGEYALVIYSDSPEYSLYTAELGGEVLGADPPMRISEQPYAGSLFKSQNATTWTAYQNEDLMFVINKAVFTTNAASGLFNLKQTPIDKANIDSVVLNTNELSFPAASLAYKVKSIYKSTGAYDSYNYIKPLQKFSYGSLLDSSNKTSVNSRKLDPGNANSVLVTAELSTTDSDISPVFNKETFSIAAIENHINNAGISNTVISITNRGLGYNATATSGNTVIGSTSDTLNNAAQLFREDALANNWNIGFYNVTISGGGGAGANGYAVANTTGANTVDYIMIVDEGSGYIQNATINIALPKATSTNANATAVIFGETGKSGGNIKAKYISRQISLEDGFESGDLRVFMDAIVPTGTDIVVYYKVLSDDDPDKFSEKSWVLMYKKQDIKSKNTNELIGLEFRPSLTENKLYYIEDGIKYPISNRFKHFAIKVGLLSSDTAVSPTVKNIRMIATPEG